MNSFLAAVNARPVDKAIRYDILLIKSIYIFLHFFVYKNMKQGVCIWKKY